MIIDFSVFYGVWPNYPVRGALEDVINGMDADIALVGTLEAVWNRNQQQYNERLLLDIGGFQNVYAVPVLDISIPTWREEARIYFEKEAVKAFRLFPNYSNFSGRDSYYDIFEFFNDLQIPLIVQKRMEDPRYNHPKAIVYDADMNRVLDQAGSYPDLRLILGGVKGNELDAKKILANQHIYFETSQIDGFQVFRNAIDSGLLERMLFGSFVPLFETGSGLMRLLPEVNDDEAGMILYKNAQKVCGGL